MSRKPSAWAAAAASARSARSTPPRRHASARADHARGAAAIRSCRRQPAAAAAGAPRSARRPRARRAGSARSPGWPRASASPRCCRISACPRRSASFLLIALLVVARRVPGADADPRRAHAVAARRCSTPAPSRAVGRSSRANVDAGTATRSSPSGRRRGGTAVAAPRRYPPGSTPAPFVEQAKLQFRKPAVGLRRRRPQGAGRGDDARDVSRRSSRDLDAAQRARADRSDAPRRRSPRSRHRRQAATG